MPRLLFINRVFPPTPGATGQLLWELAGDLARRGHDVTVLAARPPNDHTSANPTPNTTPPPDGVTVLRYGRGGLKPTNLLAKAGTYACQYPSLAWQLRRMPPMDMWISLTDPPLQSVAAAWMKPESARLVHWAQDVYPDVAEELGVIRRSGLISRMCRRLAVRSLRRHDGIVTVGRCMAERLQSRDPRGPTPQVIPNWAPLPAPRPDDEAKRRSLRASLAPDGALLIMYSGNFGRAHPFDAIADAVARTTGAGSSIYWAFIGDGPKYNWLRDAVGGMPQTRFLGPQPWSDLRVSLSAADLHLASMEHFLAGTVVPSKVYGALAVGRPCLLLGPAHGEAARLIIETGAGAVIEQASGESLAAEIQRLTGNASEWSAMRRAAEAATPRVSREGCLDRWAEFIDRTLHP